MTTQIKIIIFITNDITFISFLFCLFNTNILNIIAIILDTIQTIKYVILSSFIVNKNRVSTILISTTNAPKLSFFINHHKLIIRKRLFFVKVLYSELNLNNLSDWFMHLHLSSLHFTVFYICIVMRFGKLERPRMSRAQGRCPRHHRR